MRTFLVAAFVICGLLACKREEQQPSQFDINSLYAKYGCERPATNPAPVTIEALVASPGTYDGKPVRVEGFYYRSFEHSAIYSHPGDGEKHNTRNGLWVLGGIPKDLSGRRVTVEGIFTSKVKGHISQWPASMCAVRVVAIH